MQPSPLKAERKRRGWSQSELAKQLGVNISTVSRWEQGVTIPYPYYRNRLTALFGKTADELGLLPQADEQEERALIALQSETAPQASLLADPAMPEEALDSARSPLGSDALLQASKRHLRPRPLWKSHPGSFSRVSRFRPPNRAWHISIVLFILLGAALLIFTALPAFHRQLPPRTSQASEHSGACELVWMGQGEGSTDLDASQIRDPGLRDTLEGANANGGTTHPPGYHLLCDPGLNLPSCSLVQSTSNQGQNGNPDLDLNSSIVSPYVHDGLFNKYRLQCSNTNKSRKSNQSSTNVLKIIGQVEVSLQCQAQDTGPCTSITLNMNVRELKPSTSYDVYIADSSCPLHNSKRASLFIANVRSDSSGLLTNETTQTGSFLPFPSSENICIYDDSRGHDPQSDIPVARGHIVNSVGKPGTHAIHRITPN